MMDAIIDMSNKRAANESRNQTLTEISDFAEKYRLGEMFYSSVVLWAATRMAAYNKAVTEAISKLKYADDYAEHLIKVKSFDRNATKGITGGHNMDEFYNYFKNVEGLSEADFIEKIVQHPKFKGIYEITYKVPLQDGTGKYIMPPTSYKIFKNPKTVYDPSIISDANIMEWANEAMINGIINNTIEGTKITGTAFNGLVFEGWIDSAITDAIKVKNFYPILD